MCVAPMWLLSRVLLTAGLFKPDSGSWILSDIILVDTSKVWNRTETLTTFSGVFKTFLSLF